MIITGQALAMRLKLKNLMQRHRVQPEPCVIPLTDPTDHPMILEGYGATIDLDADRTKLRGWAFGPPERLNVPLYYKHDPDQVAGKIWDLAYDNEGNLLCRTEVHHPLARRCGAFSVAARVDDYEIRNAEGPDFYAVIRSATLTEISLTDSPSNPNALVMERYRVSPTVQVLDLMTERVARLQQLTRLIREQTNESRHQASA
jgi:hypothetical protein